MESRIKEALSLLENAHEGALATLEETRPFVSAVSFIYDPTIKSGAQWGKVQLFLSGLARHTRNLQKNPNVSLLVTEAGSAPANERKRLTLQGTIRRAQDEAAFHEFKMRYVRIFPTSEKLFGFSDFQLFEIEISEIHWIAGFGKIETFK